MTWELPARHQQPEPPIVYVALRVILCVLAFELGAQCYLLASVWR